ncbi:2Fe-2S iron-sulfur cluster-binding protein [Streptomyces sp. NPDC002870]|uniref:2Fe-2S iron-sulfur cluster-binding protein n=1 Tax=Streptomyces sp. NPDC002870 TaxID=3364666 RepID=UPI0036B4C6C8
MTLALAAEGRDTTTVEGLATDGELHPVQQAFIDKDGFQRGYSRAWTADVGSRLHPRWA